MDRLWSAGLLIRHKIGKEAEMGLSNLAVDYAASSLLFADRECPLSIPPSGSTCIVYICPEIITPAMNIELHKLLPGNTGLIHQIADWYLEEWKIPVEKTIRNLEAVTACNDQIQVVLLLNEIPVATGGVYHHVGLLDRVPRLNTHRHWLALVYTIREHRNKGLGAALCRYLEDYYRDQGEASLALFTDTAERLYARLGWEVMERLETGGRNLAVMQKVL